MSYSDSLGTWNELPIIHPIFEDWVEISLTSFYSEIFRLNFFSNDWSRKGNTWMWIRHKFYATGDRSLSIKVFPRETSLILELKIPGEFVDQGLILTSLEVKKGGRFRMGITPHVPWSVKIDEKII